MGDSFPAADREDGPETSATGWRQLAHGRDDQSEGVWKYLYRAVDKQGKTIDVLLAAKRDMAVANKAMGANGDPDKVAKDKSGANKAATDAINAGATCRF